MIAMMGGLLTLPSVEAQSRPGRGGSHTSTSGSRPSNSRPSSGSSSRPTQTAPSTRPGHGSNDTRPGHNNTTTKPAKPNKPEQGVRPGNQNVRPSAPAPSRPSKPSPSIRPSAPVRPGSSVRPAPARPVRPIGPTRPSAIAPPVRPGRPVYATPWSRPVPPASWRPARRVTIVPNILGMTLGLTLNSALDYLYTSGYSVDGYGAQEVYLRNVSELGYRWDDATLYFSNGGLVRSEFYDSTSGYSTTRFNNVYNRLISTYGNPVSQSNMGGQITATWFGYQGDYITLQYTQLSTSGSPRYFTVLSYGN